MENQNKMQTPVVKKSIFQSNTAKLIMVGALTLFLLIPLNLVQNLISERSYLKKEVTAEVAQTWGDEITFYGPLLKIPYKHYVETEIYDDKTKKTVVQKKLFIKNAYFFPELLDHKSNIEKVDDLKRGLYKPMVYKATINCTGTFANANFQKLDIKPENVLWEQAKFQLKTTNLKSIKSDLKIKFNNSTLELEAKTDTDSNMGTLESSEFTYNPAVSNDFSFIMKYNGSESISFVPIGKITTTSVDANWNSPSYFGSFAANNETKKSTDKNFHADWKIVQVNRPFAQQYIENAPSLNNYEYGVRLIETVNEYQQNERASKYGFLVIGLTFLIFFLIQTISKKSIHIFQYTMIGLALIMFYTLLISITEHSTFITAYIISAAAVIIMLFLYAISVLKERKFSLFIAISLTILYSFIFVIIQLEDYALLVGSIGLFAILGAVMYFSRKIDWNNN